ncbi:murein DD-endopeptidase MepS/murein LD-carboxypeptidase precursor [mine drainage metagenome]|uniref:Murein DD-endopeptidase MepS/murein LD-carboxypeptidase n=1 Tax=mine drainage metagenome TaxID=410659 RepID=A0A1J5S9D7_9ZZZZ
MKLTSFLIAILSLVYFTSCRSVRKITAKDNSTTQPTKKAHRKEVKFIDGIEVTPGNTVVSKHKTTSSLKRNDDHSVADANSKNNIEKADWLQLKYAVMLDATVEKLSNITLLQKIEDWWGTKYCMGGNTKNCIDCSAFSASILNDVYNVKLPRTAQEQYNMSERIAPEDLKEGDLVFFHTGGRKSRTISHVGVYIMNNKFANASTSGGVTISDLNDPYWKKRFRAAGRVIK